MTNVSNRPAQHSIITLVIPNLNHSGYRMGQPVSCPDFYLWPFREAIPYLVPVFGALELIAEGYLTEAAINGLDKEPCWSAFAH
jgi:hypothetical protein